MRRAGLVLMPQLPAARRLGLRRSRREPSLRWALPAHHALPSGSNSAGRVSASQRKRRQPPRSSPRPELPGPRLRSRIDSDRHSAGGHLRSGRRLLRPGNLPAQTDRDGLREFREPLPHEMSPSALNSSSPAGTRAASRARVVGVTGVGTSWNLRLGANLRMKEWRRP